MVRNCYGTVALNDAAHCTAYCAVPLVREAVCYATFSAGFKWSKDGELETETDGLKLASFDCRIDK